MDRSDSLSEILNISSNNNNNNNNDNNNNNNDNNNNNNDILKRSHSLGPLSTLLDMNHYETTTEHSLILPDMNHSTGLTMSYSTINLQTYHTNVSMYTPILSPNQQLFNEEEAGINKYGDMIDHSMGYTMISELCLLFSTSSLKDQCVQLFRKVMYVLEENVTNITALATAIYYYIASRSIDNVDLLYVCQQARRLVNNQSLVSYNNVYFHLQEINRLEYIKSKSYQNVLSNNIINAIEKFLNEILWLVNKERQSVEMLVFEMCKQVKLRGLDENCHSKTLAAAIIYLSLELCGFEISLENYCETLKLPVGKWLRLYEKFKLQWPKLVGSRASELVNKVCSIELKEIFNHSRICVNNELKHASFDYEDDCIDLVDYYHQNGYIHPLMLNNDTGEILKSATLPRPIKVLKGMELASHQVPTFPPKKQIYCLPKY